MCNITSSQGGTVASARSLQVRMIWLQVQDHSKSGWYGCKCKITQSQGDMVAIARSLQVRMIWSQLQKSKSGWLGFTASARRLCCKCKIPSQGCSVCRCKTQSCRTKSGDQVVGARVLSQDIKVRKIGLYLQDMLASADLSSCACRLIHLWPLAILIYPLAKLVYPLAKLVYPLAKLIYHCLKNGIEVYRSF